MEITTAKELYDTVVEDYRKHDVELNSLFFDFNVNTPKSEILSAYEELQHDINGDTVYYPEVSGNYRGNCKDFLESLNDTPGYERYAYGEETEEMKCIFVF